jgi:dihydroflavonol-4-reductase
MNTTKEKILVIGGAGFLGNNLVRELLKDKQAVRTSVRNTSNKKPFEGLYCEIVQADLLDKDSLLKAMDGIDIVYNCATVYKIWAKDPQKKLLMLMCKEQKMYLKRLTKQK